MDVHDLGGEVSRAGLYTVLGGLLLKAAEALFRRAGTKHRETLAEMDATFHAAAAYREELRKDNEELRERVVELEGRVRSVEDQLRAAVRRGEELEKENAALRLDNTDLHSELRALKRGLRTPVPPSIPPSP